MSTITTDAGQVVGYTDHGGDGPTLAFLHAFMMNREQFAKQVEAFGADYRVITIDERGHGESKTEKDYDFWEVARDVIAVLERLDVDQATIVGTSMGGFAALRVALLRPDLVARLVLVGTSAAAEGEEGTQALCGIAQTWSQVGPAPSLLDGMTQAVLGGVPIDDKWKQFWATFDSPNVTRNVKAMVTRDDLMSRLGELMSRLGELTMPALVIHGSADSAFPAAHAGEVANALPGSGEAQIIDGAPHFVSISHPDAVDALLRPFLTTELASQN
jgi:pimeloyl-ACP methyl ester carboxylesterase